MMYASRCGLSTEDLKKVVAQLPVIPLSAREFPREQFCLIYQSGVSFGSDEMGVCIELVPARVMQRMRGPLDGSLQEEWRRSV
jgi:hypothetical protein